MKQALKYYFDITVDIEDNGEIGYFLYDKSNYYFVPYLRDKKAIQDIISVSRSIKEKNIPCHDIIINKFGDVLCTFNDKHYVLLRSTNRDKEEINCFDMIMFSNKARVTDTKVKYDNLNWKSLWMQKNDYLEQQVREYAKDKAIILDSFSYYIGLAENAIEYLNYVDSHFRYDSQNNFLTICHRRIFSPNYLLNYLNPLSFIIDYEVRDYAEYFKSLFFTSDFVYDELKSFLKVKKFSVFNYGLFYARLIYPSYYFDAFEDYLDSDSKENEEKLLKIISKVNEYEDFLDFTINQINLYAPLEKIVWLKKTS